MNSPIIPNVTNPPVLSTVPVDPELPARSNMCGSYKRLASPIALFTIMMLAATPPAHASGSSMPWEQPLQQILQSIEGPVAKIVAVIIIIVTGLALAFGDTSGGFRRLIQIVFGLSIAFAASSFFLSFFSFGGGALV
ncbi:type IV secretion system protein VirB2 [Paracoccus halophilus]|uniref:Type IV secretion system protein VirB2 n=2 Tax=Paracoccus halophilus TaxID=376733 RepID=A0A1I0U6A8_9RHOB|nr:type IV secretion system protein VirB2 [Paracoccus halophilus]